MRYLSTGLPLLRGQSCHEYIDGDGLVERGHNSDSYWAQTEHCVFIALWAKEDDYRNLQQASEQLYSRLLQDTGGRGYPHLVRVWNYFSEINRVDQGLERYRQFCLGRFDAFVRQGISEAQFPAACALGHQGGDLVIYALASKITPWHFENPRQASAYHYPREFGPRSPSFARASLLALPQQPPKLFVSGTASVVGYVTQHPHDLNLQIQVTLENLRLLLTHVTEQYALQHQGSKPDLRLEVLKVYVRHKADLMSVQQRIERVYPVAAVVYVAADICRADLLVEVDGVWNLAV